MANNSNTTNDIEQALDSSTEALDSTTLAKLRQIRHDALMLSPRPPVQTNRWWVPMGAVGVTAAAALVATWLTTTVAPQAHVDGIEDIEILASADNTDLYEQMDFYEWLESQQGNKQSDAG
jgi:hypothetical protein